MLVLGIDPGTSITGYGLVEAQGGKFKPVGYGCVRTPAGEALPRRLQVIYREVRVLIERYRPDFIAVEELFFNKNTRTALVVGQARGVILLGAADAGLEVWEYTPLQVKQAVAGYGRAEKCQVQEMVRVLLSLPGIPKPDDAADALAVAICHAQSLRWHQACAREVEK